MADPEKVRHKLTSCLQAYGNTNGKIKEHSVNIFQSIRNPSSIAVNFQIKEKSKWRTGKTQHFE